MKKFLKRIVAKLLTPFFVIFVEKKIRRTLLFYFYHLSFNKEATLDEVITLGLVFLKDIELINLQEISEFYKSVFNIFFNQSNDGYRRMSDIYGVLSLPTLLNAATKKTDKVDCDVVIKYQLKNIDKLTPLFFKFGIGEKERLDILRTSILIKNFRDHEGSKYNSDPLSNLEEKFFSGDDS